MDARSAGPLDCASLVQPMDWPPARSPHDLHTALAQILRATEVVENGTRNGDGGGGGMRNGGGGGGMRNGGGGGMSNGDGIRCAPLRRLADAAESARSVQLPDQTGPASAGSGERSAAGLVRFGALRGGVVQDKRGTLALDAALRARRDALELPSAARALLLTTSRAQLSRRRRVAICLTGRERELARFQSNLLHVLRSIADLGPAGAHVFAVQPAGDDWASVRHMLLQPGGTFSDATTIERQRAHNLSAPAAFRPKGSARGFMIEIGDCAHCQDMIDGYEKEHGLQFDVVVRMRADLTWETAPAMPAPALLTSGHVHFPWMSHCQGYNDKFAVGARDVMRHYLRRNDTLNYRHRSGFYSEQFLRAAIPKAAIKHNHRGWMFCKMGRISTTRTKQSVRDWWRSMVKAPPWQRPSQLGSCASSVRAWRLWSAQHSQEEAGPLGAQALLLGLERAASKAADLTAFDHAGGATPEMRGPNAR